MIETEDVSIDAPMRPGFERVLTTEALELVAKLHRQFESRRQELLAKRVARAKRLDAGERPNFLAESQHVREGNWTIAPLRPCSMTSSIAASRSPARSTAR